MGNEEKRLRPLLDTSAFVRAAKRLVRKSPQRTTDLQKALQLLTADAFDSQLRTHKLRGDLVGLWSAKAGYDLRIIFKFVQHQGEEAILLLSVGTHDQVY